MQQDERKVLPSTLIPDIDNAAIENDAEIRKEKSK